MISTRHKYKTPRMVLLALKSTKVKRNSVMVQIRKHRQLGHQDYVEILMQGVALFDEYLMEEKHE